MQRFVRIAWWSCQHCRQQLAQGSKEKQKAPDFLDPMYVGREVVHVPVPRETTDHLVWEQSTWTSFCLLSFKYPPFHLEAQLHFCMHKAQLVLFWETSPQYLRKFDYFWEILSRSKKEKDHAVKEVLCLSHASQSMRRRNHLALSPEWTCNCLSQRFRGKVFTYAFPQTLNVTFVCRPPHTHLPFNTYILSTKASILLLKIPFLPPLWTEMLPRICSSLSLNISAQSIQCCFYGYMQSFKNMHCSNSNP